MTWGVGPGGFLPKPLAQILADINAYQLQNISTSLDVQPTALMGVLNAQAAAHLSELWQLAAALYNGMDADNANGDQLATLAAITGSVRHAATPTVVSCIVNVAAGFVAQPATMFATVANNPLNLFYNLSAVDNSASGIAANFTLYFICQDTGAVQALASTLTVIAQPLTGWNSITNPASGTVGAPIETDALLRIRRNFELSKAGISTAAAVQSAVLSQMQQPTTTVATSSVTVLANPTDVTDANGVPPHSIETIALAIGATAVDDQLLANLIAITKTAGDNTNGTTTKTVFDSQGIGYPISFTRPTPSRLYASITVSCKTAQYVAGAVGTVGSTAYQVAAALAAFTVQPAATAFVPGSTVYAKKLADACFAVSGIVDWTAFAVDTINAPVNTGNLPFGVRVLPQLAQADVVAVTVVQV